MSNVNPSKGVTDRQKSSLKLQATREQLGAVGEALATLFPGAVRTTLVAAVLLIAGLFLDWLARLTAEMVQADVEDAAEQGDNRAILDRRDAAAAEVSGILVDLRAVVETFFGTNALAPFGFDGLVSEDLADRVRPSSRRRGQTEEDTPPASDAPVAPAA